jgi:hypothetical protein
MTNFILEVKCEMINMKRIYVCISLVLILTALLSVSVTAQSTESFLGKVSIRRIYLDDYGLLFIISPHSSNNFDEPIVSAYPEYLSLILYNMLLDQELIGEYEYVSAIFIGENNTYKAWAPAKSYTDFQQFLTVVHAGEEIDSKPVDPIRIDQLVNALIQDGQKILSTYNPNDSGFLGIGSSDRIEILEDALRYCLLAAEFRPKNEKVLSSIDTIQRYIAARAQYAEAELLVKNHRKEFEKAVKNKDQKNITYYGEVLWNAHNLLAASLKLNPNHEAVSKLRIDLITLLNKDFPKDISRESLPIYISEVKIGIPSFYSDGFRISKYTNEIVNGTDSFVVEAIVYVPERGTYLLEYTLNSINNQLQLSKEYTVEAGINSLKHLIKNEVNELGLGEWELSVTSKGAISVTTQFAVIPAPDSLSGKETTAWNLAKEYIKGQLKAPSTAMFQLYNQQRAKYLGGGEYFVQIYVDSQNELRVMTRANYVVLLKYQGEGNWITSRQVV